MWQVVSGTMSLQVVATCKSLPNRARLAQRIDRLDRNAAEGGRNPALSAERPGVHAGRGGVEQLLAFPWRGVGQVDDVHDLGAAEAGDLHSTHVRAPGHVS
jgi:hypothetical protein